MTRILTNIFVKFCTYYPNINVLYDLEYGISVYTNNNRKIFVYLQRFPDHDHLCKNMYGKSRAQQISPKDLFLTRAMQKLSFFF